MKSNGKRTPLDGAGSLYDESALLERGQFRNQRSYTLPLCRRHGLTVTRPYYLDRNGRWVSFQGDLLNPGIRGEGSTRFVDAKMSLQATRMVVAGRRLFCGQEHQILPRPRGRDNVNRFPMGQSMLVCLGDNSFYQAGDLRGGERESGGGRAGRPALSVDPAE